MLCFLSASEQCLNFGEKVEQILYRRDRSKDFRRLFWSHLWVYRNSKSKDKHIKLTTRCVHFLTACKRIFLIALLDVSRTLPRKILKFPRRKFFQRKFFCPKFSDVFRAKCALKGDFFAPSAPGGDSG